jgi:hypothetical protein
MHINSFSHFIIINALHQYKTKLYPYNTLLMSIKIQHINYVDFIFVFEMQFHVDFANTSNMCFYGMIDMEWTST